MTASARPLVIVPALNEERSVAAVVRAVRELGLPVCVVDDGSSDRTARAAAGAGATVVRMPVNLGVGGALRCGFRYAVEQGYEVVVQVDGDGQHDPAQIPLLLAAMEETGADLVVGSRVAASSAGYTISRGRRLAMRVLARRAGKATGVRITDSTSGFRAIRGALLRRFADEYPVEYLGDTVEALISAGRFGARVVELPVTMSPRAHGRASAGVLASVWYLVRVLAALELMHRRRKGPPLAPPDDHQVVP